MAKPAIETVLFRLGDGVTKGEFLAAAEEMRTFIESQPGFVQRRLSCTGDGTWIEHIEWETIDAAKNAAANIGQSEHAAAFVKAIDGPSIELMHSTLEVSLG